MEVTGQKEGSRQGHGGNGTEEANEVDCLL